MERINISIYEWMEDFDNQDLTLDERREELEEAIKTYNERYNTNYKLKATYFNYLSWLRDKYKGDY